MKPRILVIDDEAAIRDSLRMILEYEHYEFIGASSGPDGIAAVKRDTPDLVLLDIKMPGMNGLEALAEIRRVDEALPVAMISGHGTITDAMQATRLGAFDFIEKPFTSERVLVTVSKGLEVRELRQENRELKLAMESKYEIVGNSPSLRKVLEAVKRAAPTNATVLLLGESGVGKNWWRAPFIATVHARSQRFVQVNCAAIPEELIESELFGHEKGSFTGATESRSASSNRPIAAPSSSTKSAT
jgi:two-component system nitrogen regulation response regulator NtrX